MEASEQPARPALLNGSKRPPLVSPSKSTISGSNGSAGIAPSVAANSSKLSPAAIAFANGRKISQRTLELLGVASGTTFYPALNRKSEGVFFPYREGWKSRAFPEKAFVAGKGFKLDFWNIEAVLRSGAQRIYITEGELDACALVEAGIDRASVLSVPNGAVERTAESADGVRGYEYVQRALSDGLARAKQFIWCGDNDNPGLSLRSDMAQIFGPARFYFVDWPEGCKDANDVLMKEGPQFLRGLATEGALPWPVNGLYRLSEIPEAPALSTWATGMFGWDRHVKLAPATLSVVTGMPGHGKTVFWAQIWKQISERYETVSAVASFETRAKPHYRKILRGLHAGAPEWKLTDDQIRAADRFINDRYLFLIHPDNRPTLEWFLDSCEVAVVRHGARVVQLDPWNRLEGSRSRNESETDYIGRCLREIHTFAHDMNCHVQIVAHPSKLDGKDKHFPPTLRDISGSSHWDNMVDQGFVVHRPKIFDGGERQTKANFYHRKARFDELGYPCKLEMNYNLATASYEVVNGQQQPQQEAPHDDGDSES